VATDIDRPTESLLRFSAQILYMCSWIHVQSHKMWSQCLFTSAPQLLKNWWLFSCLLVNMFRDHWNILSNMRRWCLYVHRNYTKYPKHLELTNWCLSQGLLVGNVVMV